MLAFIPIAAYLCLATAVLGLWVHRWIWIGALAAAAALAYVGGVLSGPAVLWIGAFAFACWLYRRPQRLPRIVGVFTIVSLGVQLALHVLPGFHNVRVADDLKLSADAAPYDLYLNFDKTLIGVLFVGIAWPHLIQTRQGWTDALRSGAPWIALNVLVLITLSLALGHVRVDPKWTSFFWLWASANLLSTCLAEEAFFRGFVQHGLAQAMRGRRGGEWMALSASAALFGLAHFAGGWTYVLLSTIAGVGYGLVFQRTGRLEMAMLAHFAVNAVHFLFFTYPMLDG